MTPRLSRRGQRLLAAGLVLCSLILVAGGMWWFTRSESAPAALSNARTVKLFVTQPGMVQVTAADLRAIGWGDRDLSALSVTSDGVALPVWADATALRFF